MKHDKASDSGIEIIDIIKYFFIRLLMISLGFISAQYKKVMPTKRTCLISQVGACAS